MSVSVFGRLLSPIGETTYLLKPFYHTMQPSSCTVQGIGREVISQEGRERGRSWVEMIILMARLARFLQATQS